MKKFSKDSSEYIENGHYKINEVDFMSVWTFKNKYGIKPNDNTNNGTQGKELIQRGIEYHASTPDFGGFEEIYIYPVEALKNYYGV
ncbi:MAG: hypothetical protein KF900_08255 [Bacteroidetes bacterium]|nr:hypothetical protein [Bacteroidota bacterium]